MSKRQDFWRGKLEPSASFLHAVRLILKVLTGLVLAHIVLGFVASKHVVFLAEAYRASLLIMLVVSASLTVPLYKSCRSHGKFFLFNPYFIMLILWLLLLLFFTTTALLIPTEMLVQLQSVS